ncbi:MAG: hypothetical protein ACI8W7_003419 [Gammaproteobacteria bacterium]|jgi:hypothetical protein
MKKHLKFILPVIGGSLLFSSGLLAQSQGSGGSVAQGAAGTNGASDDSTQLARCNKPMGAMAVVEPQDYMMEALASHSLQSPVGVIRMMIQQSNCFIVVERGKAFQNMRQERSLSNSGMLRESSNVGGGQMVAADFIMTPSIVFSNNDAGGVGGGLAGLLGGNTGRTFGAILGSIQVKEAQTSMLVADARSGVQVAAAEGSAQNADLSLAGFLGGPSAVGGLGGYQNTAEGKVIVASLVDNYNNIVRVVRNDPNLQRNVGTLANEAAQGATTRAGAVLEQGDVLAPKINNVRVMSSAADNADVIATLSRDDEMIYMGKEQNGFVFVETGQGGGWVKKLLIRR